jgi:hypothetical protein
VPRPRTPTRSDQLPAKTLARSAGSAGTALVPLHAPQKGFVLSAALLHADETPVALLLDPGAGKTRTACVLAYARSELDAERGVIHEFCRGRGSQYPVAFLGATKGPPGSSIEDTPAWPYRKSVCEGRPGELQCRRQRACLSRAQGDSARFDVA